MEGIQAFWSLDEFEQAGEDGVDECPVEFAALSSQYAFYVLIVTGPACKDFHDEKILLPGDPEVGLKCKLDKHTSFDHFFFIWESGKADVNACASGRLAQ